MSYNELKQHGTWDFPIELYCLDKNHHKYEMASHWHTEIEIIRILKGELDVRLDKNEYLAKSGDVLFVNPETIHTAYPVGNCVYECIVLNLKLLSIDNIGCRFFIDGISNHELFVNEFISNCSGTFKDAVDNLFNAMKRKSSGYKFVVIGALYQLFGIIVDNHLYSSNTNSNVLTDKNMAKLKNVLYFIRTNYDKQITLNEMASAAGMTPKYFCYFFRNMTDKTPFQYLNICRIENASQKLLLSDESVTEIAFSCGFNDLSYFIKTFKAIKGVTPSNFRKN